jgi:hypothetical protein
MSSLSRNKRANLLQHRCADAALLGKNAQWQAAALKLDEELPLRFTLNPRSATAPLFRRHDSQFHLLALPLTARVGAV